MNLKSIRNGLAGLLLLTTLLPGVAVAAPKTPTATPTATQQGTTDPVYVTAHGKKFHRKTCSHAKNATSISRADAEKKGLTPCKTCKP
jgi:hypothetical protein